MGLSMKPKISEKAPDMAPCHGPRTIPATMLGIDPNPILIPSTPPMATLKDANLVKITDKAIKRPVIARERVRFTNPPLLVSVLEIMLVFVCQTSISDVQGYINRLVVI